MKSTGQLYELAIAVNEIDKQGDDAWLVGFG